MDDRPTTITVVAISCYETRWRHRWALRYENGQFVRDLSNNAPRMWESLQLVDACIRAEYGSGSLIVIWPPAVMMDSRIGR